MFWPKLSPRVTEEAGTRYGTHTGIDLAANLNDPLIAPFAGQVVFVGGDGASGSMGGVVANGQGKTVDIRRADGLIARLGHMNGYAVVQGQWVSAGQVVGYAGNTGYSTGVHCHWETRWDRAWNGGNWVNPRLFNPQVFRSIPDVPVYVPTFGDLMSVVYLRATTNSSPGKDGTSRIWAGEGREITTFENGKAVDSAKYSDTWALDLGAGSIHRILASELPAIKAAYAAGGLKFPVSDVGGNVIESIMFVKRARG